MIRLTTFLLILFSLVTSCTRNGSQGFSLIIKHYAGGPGITLIYNLNEKDLQVETNCDLENCKQKTVYKRIFTKNESDSISKFITSLQLDTLKSSYETKGIMDGLFTKLTIKDGFSSSHSSTFDNFTTPTTDTLFNYVDSLILIKKYRFHSWGQDE
jgi:hypothetical protein